MSFQIAFVSIYSHDGRRRDVPFTPGKLNIITGKSETGKSALVSIVNYCLGAGTYRIPVATIHDKCSWFGVTFVKGKKGLFVARPRLPAGQKSHSAVCVLTGLVTPPEFDELVANENTTTLLEALASFAGIADVETAPEKGRTTESINPSIKHARNLVLQPQSIVSSERQLLYGTDDTFKKLHLRDTIPYFLGVVPEDFAKRRARLREARRELKLMTLKEEDSEARKGRLIRDVNAIRSQALDSGIVDLLPIDDDQETAMTLLKQIAAWDERQAESTDLSTPELSRLRREYMAIEDEVDRLRSQLDSAEAFSIRSSSFAEEGARQESRLKLVSIFEGTYKEPRETKSKRTTAKKEEVLKAACPICQTALEGEDNLIKVVRESNERLREQLNTAERQRPRLSKYLKELRVSLADQEQKAGDIRDSITSVIKARKEVQEQQSAALRRARVSGRASELLQTVELSDDVGIDERAKRRLNREIKDLEKICDDEAIGERLRSAETVISNDLSQIAVRLQLQQSDTPVIFDMKALDLKFAIGLETVSLERIGAGKNWVGYHVAAHLALHNWLVKQKRPVPRFVFFDQVSQPFFSNEAQQNPVRTEKDLVDVDRTQVMRLIGELHSFCESQKGKFQILLTEHVESSEEWFRDSVVETWRGGKALVPLDWPDLDSLENN